MTSLFRNISILAIMKRGHALPLQTGIVLTALLLSFVCSAQAVEEAPTSVDTPPVPTASMFPASDWTRETTYSAKVSQKLGFGFLNMTAGWTAFFYEPTKEGNFFKNLGKGVLYMATNTVGGVLHAATFPIPIDIPLPHGGIVHEYEK